MMTNDLKLEVPFILLLDVAKMLLDVAQTLLNVRCYCCLSHQSKNMFMSVFSPPSWKTAQKHELELRGKNTCKIQSLP